MKVQSSCWLVNDLRSKARAVIVEKCLSSPLPISRWGGPGAGGLCPVCGNAVEKRQFGVEIELPDQGTNQFHVPCLLVLEEELAEPT